MTAIVLPLPIERPKKRRWERLAEGIYRRGRVIVLDFTIHGRRIHRRLGRISVTEARRIAAELRGEFARRSAGLAPAVGPVRVEEILAARLDESVMKAAPTTAVRNRQHVLRLARHFGGVDARTLGPEDIRRYQRIRQGEGASNATINREVLFLRAAVRAAARQGKLERDPLDGLDWRLPEREPGSVARVLSDDEIEKVRATAEPWFGRFVVVANAIGCRAGELATARIEDVDLVRRRITFRAEATKGRRGRRRPREIHLSDEALAAVRQAVTEAQAAGSRYVFPAPRDASRPVGTDGVTQAWRQTIRRAGVPHARLHDLRHTFITRLVRRGVSPSIIRRIVGHASTQMIDQRYAHLAPDDLAAAVLDAAGPTRGASAPSLI